jgi:hypothetical protein
VATHGAFVAHVCRVIRSFPLQGLKLSRVTVKPSNMGATCLLQSFNSNSTRIMLYLYHEMEVDYLVVNEMFHISKLIDYNCMFNICCKPILITTQTWLKIVKSAEG